MPGSGLSPHLLSFFSEELEKTAKKERGRGYRNKLQPGDILSISTKSSPEVGTISRIFGTGSQAAQGSFTHSGLYVGDGKIVESRIGEGVTLKPIREALRGLNFQVHRPKGVPKRDRREAAQFAVSQVGKDYDSTALAITSAGIMLPEWTNRLIDKKLLASPREGKKYTCSNLVSAAYHKAELTGSRTKKLVTPADLRASQKLKLIVEVKRKGFEEKTPWRGSRIRRRWKERETSPEVTFTKR